MSALIGVALVTSAGCGSPSTSPTGGSSPLPGTAAVSPEPTKCCVAPPSPQLTVRITPATGPPGTIVYIQAAGCDDPSGQNHAISFNNDALNPAARNDPNTVRSINAVQHGTRLMATYKIVRGDVTGGVGTFFVQCGQSLRQANFHVAT